MMHEPGCMGRREPTPSLDEALEDLRGRVGPTIEPATEIGVAVLQREEGRASVLADVVDGQHVGMAELGHRPGLVERRLDFVARVASEQLDGDLAVELQVVGLEHRSEAAVAEGPADLEATTDQVVIEFVGWPGRDAPQAVISDRLHRRSSRG